MRSSGRAMRTHPRPISGSNFSSEQVAHARFATYSSIRLAACLVMVSVSVAAGGCRAQDDQVKQHQIQFESLGSTTAAIGEAWLSGNTSERYTRTALEHTYRLGEQERTSFARTPRALLDPRIATLSQQAEQLSRLLAEILRDVDIVDHVAARQHLATIPILPSNLP